MSTKVLIIGGDNKVMALLDSLLNAKGINIVGFCDADKNSVCMQYAHRLGLYTTTDLSDFIGDKSADIIIETSGSKKFQKVLLRITGKETKIIDAKAAELLLSIAEEKEKAKKDLLEAKIKLESMLENMSEGVVALDKNQCVVLINSMAKKLLSIKDAWFGKPFWELVQGKNILELLKDISSGKLRHISKEINIIKGKLIYVIKIHAAVVCNYLGDCEGWILLLTDITKEKDVDRIKTEFISTTSHELRTPLAAIKESVMLILDETAGKFNPQQGHFLDIAKRNIDRLTNLLNDLLDISKIESGKFKLNKSEIDIELLISNTLNTLDMIANQNKISVSHKVERGLPLIECDPERIAQVLINLVGNSLKFTPAGGKIIVAGRLLLAAKETVARKKIETSDQKSANDRDFIEISVSDTGVGIDKEDIYKLFTKFGQIDGSLTRRTGGAGLGLAICKKLIEMHGGKIWVDLKQGKGSILRFTLPVNSVQ